MHTLLRLPFILLEMALRQGAGAVKEIVRLLAGGDGDGGQDRPDAPAERRGPDPAEFARAARREAETVAAEEARARRPEARPRAAARRRPAPPPPPAAPPEPPPAPEAELLGDEPSHVSREAETVASFGPADDPSPAIQVQAPWSGYDDQPAAEIVKRVRAADEATKAVVLLYERGHKSRSSVIRAAGGQPATA
jgi:hypothetical protein